MGGICGDGFVGDCEGGIELVVIVVVNVDEGMVVLVGGDECGVVVLEYGV